MNKLDVCTTSIQVSSVLEPDLTSTVVDSCFQRFFLGSIQRFMSIISLSFTAGLLKKLHFFWLLFLQGCQNFLF